LGRAGTLQPSLRIEGCETAILPWRATVSIQNSAGRRATTGKLWPLPPSADRRPL